MQRFCRTYDKLRKHGLTGDLGAGLLAGVAVCIALSVAGDFGQKLHGVPHYAAYGGVVAVAVTLISNAAGWMPEVEQTDQADT